MRTVSSSNVTFNLYKNVQLVKRDIVAPVIYCYITTEFYYAKRDSRCLSAYRIWLHSLHSVSLACLVIGDICLPPRKKYLDLSNEYKFTYVKGFLTSADLVLFFLEKIPPLLLAK